MQTEPQSILQSLSTNQANAKGNKRSREDWQKIIDDQRKSLLSQKRFCAKNNISLNQFVYQKTLLSTSKGSSCIIAPIVIQDNKFDQSPQPDPQTNKSSEHFIFGWKSGNKLTIPSNANLIKLKQICSLLGESE